MRRDVFQAIADPTRRDIIALIANETLRLNDIADHFEVSRPAISKHLKILDECGLVEIRQEGRERLCTAKLGQLDEVAEWMAPLKKIWEARFDKLDKYLEELQNKNHKK